MSLPSQPRGFTLVELVVATGVGMFVLVTAYGAVRSASRTIQASERLALENRLLRAGFIYALDEIDYWTLYDDPTSVGGQPLRGHASVALPSTTVIAKDYGLPFTPMKDLPADDHDTGTTVVRLRPGETILPTADEQADAALVLTADLDRGWDMHRPYQASHPVNWSRSRLLQGSSDIQLYGRYGLFAHVKRWPSLGTGPMTADPYPSTNTGTFGQPSASDSHTFTLYDNRIDYIWRVLGNYGAMDYLPANTLYGFTYGLRTSSGDNDEATDDRYSPRFGRGLGRSISVGSTPAIVPASPFSGQDSVGFVTDGSDVLDDGDMGIVAGSALSPTLRILSHRKKFVSEYSHIYFYGDTYNRLIQVPPLTPQRPGSWPDLRLAFLRTITKGRFAGVGFVRWLDQTTGKEVELEVCALGTTLRGARQQRHRDGGWATFYGVRYDPIGEDLDQDGVLDPGEDRNANGKLDINILWDNPHRGSETGYLASENNDPTLDYPADPPVASDPIPVPAVR